MKILNVLLATWLWWITMFGSTWDVCSLRLPSYNNYKYQKFTFETEDATPDSYQALVEQLREALIGGVDRGFPVLRSEIGLPATQRFILVELTRRIDRETRHVVTLVMDAINAYIVGYNVGNQAYFFSDAPTIPDDVFPGSTGQSMPHTGSYGDLEGAAHLGSAGRENLRLGGQPLENAISTLVTSSHNYEQRARSLLIIIQMIAEATRFRLIERVVRRSFRTATSFRPGATIRELENSWDLISASIQHSNQQGALDPAIHLQTPGDTPSQIDWYSINEPTLVSYLGVMIFVCKKRVVQFAPLLIKSVIPSNKEVCTVSEQTLRIVGLNGLCADVKKGDYHNENPIIMWPYKSNADVNQLWTLKTDGTIRTNGNNWCMTTFENPSPGNYVMIFNCQDAATDAINWRVLPNGDIIHTKSKLYLTSKSWKTGATLTVEEHKYTLGQGWRLTNNSNPDVVTIVNGYNDFCLQANGQNLLLKECESGKAEQQWALYPDGSIRSNQNKDTCLTRDENDQIATVTLAPCKPALSTQRWLFTNDGTITHFATGLVMDADTQVPSDQIYVSPFANSPTQKWFPKL